ncbi:MAG: hypothetical protein QY332_19135 [Anaerolineales bacterium]|nr:MAG: hypothetical protein QY332_19135 [Anaerolineales bacterium]
MGGLFIVFTLLSRETSRLHLLLAGTFFALAIGTRFLLLIPISVVTAMVGCWILRSYDNPFQKGLSLLSFASPLLFCAASLGWYNWARFGSITEFGLYYQMAGFYIQEVHQDLFKPIYIMQNVYNYLLNPFRFEAQFPFFIVENGSNEAVFHTYPLPELYTSQQITGLLYTAPFIVFSIIPMLTLFSTRLEKFSSLAHTNMEDGHFYSRISITLSAVFLSAFGFLMTFFWAAMRYMEDFVPSLMILSVIGFWQGYQILANRPALRKSFIFVGLALAIVSIVVSNLVAISINDLRFLFAGKL